ncbi:MAG: hypothetical protein ACR2PG_18420 [Hyphomicrobiaceae bacterium]
MDQYAGVVAHLSLARELAIGTVKPVLKRNWAPYPGLFAYFPQNSQKACRIRVLLEFYDEKSIERWRRISAVEFAEYVIQYFDESYALQRFAYC